jgi:hypothetical protein
MIAKSIQLLPIDRMLGVDVRNAPFELVIDENHAMVVVNLPSASFLHADR